MVKISLFTSRTPSGAGHFPSVDGTYQRTSPRRRPVHVQGEDRRAAAEAVGVIGGPLAHEPPTAGRVREQDPARAAPHLPARAPPHPPRGTPRILRSPKAGVESALVQSPTRPETKPLSRVSTR